LKRIIEKCKRDGFVTMGVGVSGYDGVKEIYSYNTVAKIMQKSLRMFQGSLIHW
jgi:hypothetical protein